MEIDYKKGQIKLLATPCDKETPDCFRAFSVLDLVEMIRKNIDGAIFSLDPVDPDMAFHPFNTMRFAPTRLYQSRFLETLLSTDYLLKFLTIGQEVRGVYPFDVQPLEHLTQHLPEYLKKVIDDFHHAQQSESIHRFWIEAEYLLMAIDDKKLEKEGVQGIHLYDVNMVVKKHLMRRDPQGHLVDDTETHEGWFFYLLTTQQKNALDRGQKQISEPAMIFLMQGRQIFFLDHGEKSTATLQNYDTALEDLRSYTTPDANGKIIETSRSLSIIYRITREVERQLGKPHKYSPEFIFAQEFTNHYEEFGLYFPEFRRLQELSRVVALIRVLNSVRQNNQETLKTLNQKLSEIRAWEKDKKRDHPLKSVYQEIQTAVLNSVKAKVSELQRELSYETLLSQKKTQLRDLKDQIGSFSFHIYGSEVNSICQKMHDDAVTRYGYAHSTQIWSQVNNERNAIAQQLATTKREQCQRQLYELFSPRGGSHNNINQFMDYGTIDPLAEELATYEYHQAKTQVSQLLMISVAEAENVLRGSPATAEIIRKAASQVADKQFAEFLDKQKQQFVDQIKSHESLEREIRTLGLGSSPEEIDLLGLCLWVPANVKHNVSVAHSSARFVYGGVSVQPMLAQANGVISNPNSRSISAQQVGGSGGSGGGPGQFDRRAITQGFQDHHIISNKNAATVNHPLIQKAGFDLDSRANRIFLLTDASLHPTRSIHMGRHTQDVSDRMADKMNGINRLGESRNWTQEQYSTALRGMLAQERVSLKTGDIALNKHMRPWAQ